MKNNIAIKYLISLLLSVLLLAAGIFGCGSDGTASLPETTVSIVVDGPISAVFATEIDFPESLTFNVEAESVDEITHIALHYRINRITGIPSTAMVSPKFTPGRQVQSSWVWQTKKASLPPGAEIEYRWLIANDAGDRLESEWVMLKFDDRRYDWNELTEGNVRLLWYDGKPSFGEELMDAVTVALKRLAEDIGARLENEVSIYIYANTEDLQGALLYPQEWTGGIAFTDYGIIAIGVSPENLEWGKRTVAHELAHQAIHLVTYSPYGGIPTWLDEGLAMYVECELREDLQDMLKDAISSDTLFSVRSLASSFPAETDAAGLAYAQSYSLVEFLIDTYGQDHMQRLLQLFHRGSITDDALLEVYDFDSNGLDNAWRDSLGLPSRLVA